MPVIVNSGGYSAGGAATHSTIKCGTLTSTQDITFAYSEIDTISNDDPDNDLTLTLYDKKGANVGQFVIKPEETLNDVNFTGSKIGFAGTKVNARYILLG